MEAESAIRPIGSVVDPLNRRRSSRLKTKAERQAEEEESDEEEAEREEVEELNFENVPPGESIPGVHYNPDRKSWRATWTINGQRFFRSFGVKVFGSMEEARRAAIECRLENIRNL